MNTNSNGRRTPSLQRRACNFLIYLTLPGEHNPASRGRLDDALVRKATPDEAPTTLGASVANGEWGWEEAKVEKHIIKDRDEAHERIDEKEMEYELVDCYPSVHHPHSF